MAAKRPHLRGTIRVPGDKSISHRALIFSALAQGENQIVGLSPAEDCQSTIACLTALGLDIKRSIHTKEDSGESSGEIKVTGHGLNGLVEPQGILDAGNSGTTIRLLAGLLSGRPFKSTLDGDQSLRSRPMSRVLKPLTEMGTTINYINASGYAPFSIHGSKLKGREFEIPTASAQVQTALLLAGLQAEGETIVKVPGTVRDHTSRMFQHIGVPYQDCGNGGILIKRLKKSLPPFQITVPGDISSAAFFMVAASFCPNSEIRLNEVGLNPGRRLVLDVLLSMDANIIVDNERILSGEPVADLIVKSSGRLNGATIDGATIAAGIDEIPILALAGSLCEGKFSVRGAEELRVKESDRIAAIVSNLQKAGAKIGEYPDGFDIEGQPTLAGGSPWQTFGDHRLAMTGLVANLLCENPLQIDDLECAKISYPSFNEDLHRLLN